MYGMYDIRYAHIKDGMQTLARHGTGLEANYGVHRSVVLPSTTPSMKWVSMLLCRTEENQMGKTTTM